MNTTFNLSQKPDPLHLSLELGRERAAGPLPDGLCGLVHGALLASILANWGVHEIVAGSEGHRDSR